MEDKTAGGWCPFRLWDAQRDVVGTLHVNRFMVALKARQLGFTWVVLAYALWLLLFRRGTVLLFSQTDKEAAELLRRLTEMHARLPAFLSATVSAANQHALSLASGASAMAFATTARAGRSYTATFVVIDEADYVLNLQALLNATKPTIDAGGQLVLLSTADKAKPESTFKKIYRAARCGPSNYVPVFHGWQARPGRTQAWYDAEAASSLAQTGSLDHLWQEYPATDTEALAARVLDKRLSPEWLEQCYRPLAAPPLPHNAPSLPGLTVYHPPVPGRVYSIGADPAEGNPTSDDSASTVIDAQGGQQMATLVGKFQPTTFAAYLIQLGVYYERAAQMVERNNHGHTVLSWLIDSGECPVLFGLDGRPGWLSSEKGKVVLYDRMADALRHKEVTVHDFTTMVQLQSIEGNTLRAPEGQPDDCADCFALAVAGAPGAIELANEAD